MFTSAHKSTPKLILICKACQISCLAIIWTSVLITCFHILLNKWEKLAWVLMSEYKLNVLILGS